MTSLHRNIPIDLVRQFADLDSICIAEVDIDESYDRQIETIAIQVGHWSQEWMTRTEFLTSTVVPLGVKITLVNMTIKDGRRLCMYEAVLRS